MYKTPWVLAGLQAIVALFLGFATYVSKENWASIPGWLQPFAGYVAGRELWWIFVATAIGITLPLIDRAIGAFAFRKSRVQRILDQMIAELFDAEPQTHRITLFKAARGWFVWGVLLRRVWSQDDWLPVFAELFRTNPFGLYLYVYARPRKARNPSSCAVYRVYRHRQRDCDGMAGAAWVDDEITKRNVQSFAPGTLRSMKELDSYEDGHPYRAYAAETNISAARQLRAREQYGRHFHGTVIVEGGSGTKWGVLLLDSSAVKCPIPEMKRSGDKGELFNRDFNRYATTLSQILT